MNLNKYQTRSQQPLITQTLVGSLRAAFPPLSEQNKIASILSIVDKKIEQERQRKNELEYLKKGLINDLLTGKVRVKVT
jgi:type I restriction enzyme S subunit